MNSVRNLAGGYMRYILSIVGIATLYVVLKNEVLTGPLTLGATVIFVAILGPLLWLASRVWWSYEREDQKKRNESIKKRYAGVPPPVGSGEDLPQDSTLDGPRPDSMNVEPILAIDPYSNGTRFEIAQPSASGATVLFIRPFKLDGILGFRNPRLDSAAAYFVPFYRLSQPDAVTIDEAIRRCLAGIAELVAIGLQGDALGATKFETTEEEWRQSFGLLCARAIAIVVFPSSRPGTSWEISEICAAQELLRKAIFLVPPAAYGRVDSDFTVERMTSQLRGHGCEVPDDIKEGEGLIFNESKALRERMPFIKSGLFEYEISKKGVRKCVQLAVTAGLMASESS